MEYEYHTEESVGKHPLITIVLAFREKNKFQPVGLTNMNL